MDHSLTAFIASATEADRANSRELGAIEMALYDELLLQKSYPPEWEQEIPEALARLRAHDFRDKTLGCDLEYLCARVLVEIQSEWEGLEPLVSHMIRQAPSLDRFYTIREYAIWREWSISEELKESVRASFASPQPIKRTIVKIDGFVRELLRRCSP